MIDPLESSLRIAGAGIRAQSTRLRVVTENIANAESTGSTPGADPYVRKTTTFDDAYDRAAGTNIVGIRSIGTDASPFRIEHNPGHPAADENGNVKLPNVDLLIEMADAREANRSYEANLQTFKQTRELFAMTLDLLKSS